MPELQLLGYYKKMCQRKIVFDFQGTISQDMVVGMAELIRHNFLPVPVRPGIAKKIFDAFVEMAQNVANYSAERVHLDNKDLGSGIIMLTKNGQSYFVTSGNLVDKQEVPQITEHCQKINHMDNEQLKLFYKKKIRAERRIGKKGAGVGLIKIARKSQNPISFDVKPVDDAKSFLVLSVEIREEQEKMNG